MRVALFGGTGYIGGYITEALIGRGHQPVLLVRPGSEGRIRRREQCEIITGDIGDGNAVDAMLAGVRAAVYCIGIIRESPAKGITFDALHYQGVRRTAEAAGRLGVRRYLLISANGVRPDGTPYQRTKYMGEEYLRRSRLDWTIFRPSLVFGDPRGAVDFSTELRDRIIRSPFPAPLFYRGVVPRTPGAFSFTPVFAGDVAEAAARAIDDTHSVGMTVPLCGRDSIAWKSLIRIVAHAAGLSTRMMPVPAGAMMAVTRLCERIPGYPVTGDQLRMLLEGNACDGTAAFRQFGIDPLRYVPGHLAYLRDRTT